LLILASGLTAMDLKELLNGARQNDPDFLDAVENYQQAQDDHDKQMISASTERDKVNVEISFLNAQKSYRSSLLKFYQNLVGMYYGIFDDILDLQIKDNNLKTAKIDLGEKTQLYQKGLVVEEDVREASITYLQAELDKNAAEFALKSDLEELKWRTGLDLDKDQFYLLPTSLPTPGELKVSTITYMEKNLDVRTAELNLKRAKMDLDSLTSASQYDVNKAKRALSSAERQLSLTKYNASADLQGKLFNLDDLYNRLVLAKESWEVQKSRFEVTKTKYEKGLISERDLLTAENQLLSKARAYFQSERSYILALMEFLLDYGYEQPLEMILNPEG